MTVYFRADASHLIGTGHVMRCLTLASALAVQGFECKFICREQPGNLITRIREKGFDVVALADTAGYFDQSDSTGHGHFLKCSQAHDANECLAVLSGGVDHWVIVDHYGLDWRWEKTLISSCMKLIVIDDLADRAHHCHILLDQTFGRAETDYQALVPDSCKLLCGSQFALLRPEFPVLRERSLRRREKCERVKKIIITMGGIDVNNVAGKVLGSLRSAAIPRDCEITIVTGIQFPWLATIENQAARMPNPTSVCTYVDNMAELMAECDLAIGAAGSTSWERCCLGLPTALVVLANNQQLIARKLVDVGAAFFLTTPAKDIDSLWLDPTKLAPENLFQMSLKAASVTDGLGVRRTLEVFMTS